LLCEFSPGKSGLPIPFLSMRRAFGGCGLALGGGGFAPEVFRANPRSAGTRSSRRASGINTDAQFIGFRIVRPLKVVSAAEMQACWNSGVEKDDARLNKAE
jgi:hypothetical protein